MAYNSLTFTNLWSRYPRVPILKAHHPRIIMVKHFFCSRKLCSVLSTCLAIGLLSACASDISSKESSSNTSYSGNISTPTSSVLVSNDFSSYQQHVDRQSIKLTQYIDEYQSYQEILYRLI